jgi:hypothetical protein
VGVLVRDDAAQDVGITGGVGAADPDRRLATSAAVAGRACELVRQGKRRARLTPQPVTAQWRVQHVLAPVLGELGAVERAEAALDVVEAVAELVELQRGEAERVGVVADPP